ncbi:MAG: AMP-binding protein [Clostridiales bacterium]|jgi:fatty-acyl-CoA synthase|nr:AMP-binding protein [Clostridiales bacterium]
MDLIRKTLGQVLKETADRFPDTLAVKYTDRDYERTYREFDDECGRLARAFIALGYKKGDHMAVWATNTPEWIMTLFAAAKIGVVLVTVNTNYKIFELEYQLKQCDARGIVLIDGFKDSNYTEIIRTLCPTLGDGKELHSEKFPFLKHIIYAGKNRLPSGMLAFDSLLDNIAPVELLKKAEASLDPDDIINMQYTSGTTGFPKGVMLSHYNLVNNGKSIGDCMKLTEKDKYCICVPFFHCFGLVLSIFACVTHGSSMIPIEYYRPVSVMSALSNEKCTAINGVPTMFIAMLEHADFLKYDFSHLRTGIMAGSPCPVKAMQDVVDKMNMKEITIVFGQTESSPGCTQTTVDDPLERRVSTVGRTLPHVEAKIVDPDTGATLPPNTPGEFCAKGYNIMKGYYKMPEATASVIDKDGWLHTGDLASCDEHGYYKVVGRIKDMIIRGGENIYPKEIEEFLYTHPFVSDVQVIGIPDKQYGEEVMAVVVKKPGADITEDQLKEYLKSRISRHKVPRYVRFVDSFPVTASGKIQKYKLREEAIEILKLQEDASIETA